MVCKNCNVGKIEGVTLVELGHGDVKLSSLNDENGLYCGIGFHNHEVPAEIGTEFEDKGNNTDLEGIDAMPTFRNIKSFEVFIERCELVKKHLIKLNLLK